jgi:hypothetical protein
VARYRAAQDLCRHQRSEGTLKGQPKPLALGAPLHRRDVDRQHQLRCSRCPPMGRCAVSSGARAPCTVRQYGRRLCELYSAGRRKRTRPGGGRQQRQWAWRAWVPPAGQISFLVGGDEAGQWLSAAAWRDHSPTPCFSGGAGRINDASL